MKCNLIDTDTHQFVCNGHCYQQWYLRDTDTQLYEVVMCQEHGILDLVSRY
jgi:hypothetical protein